MTGRELVKLLEKEGWFLDRIKGSHHIMIKDNKTLSVPIHGSKPRNMLMPLQLILPNGKFCFEKQIAA